MAALNNEPVDRLTACPLACGLLRKLLPGNVTYREWSTNPKLFADAFIAGQRKYNYDFTIGLMDLSVMAGDLGAHVRMDEENTPFIDGHIIDDPEDYEKLEVPDIRKGRCATLLEGTRLMAEALNKETVTAGFLEGPLLTLSQSAGAERMFMDMFTNPDLIHKAMKVTTAYCLEMTEAFGQTGVQGLCWDFLWGNYACLGDAEYSEFEADQYASKVNAATKDNGMALAIHNCADLPHLDTQIKKYKPAIYSMAYYPLIPGSPTVTEVIEKGYADDCLITGVVDPQLFIRGTPEKMAKATADVCNEAKAALKARGLNSTYCIAPGCEVPPDINAKLEQVEVFMDAVRTAGAM